MVERTQDIRQNFGKILYKFLPEMRQNNNRYVLSLVINKICLNEELLPKYAMFKCILWKMNFYSISINYILTNILIFYCDCHTILANIQED